MQELARKNEQRILLAMADSKQCHIAELMGTSESSVSRMKEGDIARLAFLLAVLGLKVVPDSTKVFDPNLVQADKIGAMVPIYIAKRHPQAEGSA